MRGATGRSRPPAGAAGSPPPRRPRSPRPRRSPPPRPSLAGAASLTAASVAAPSRCGGCRGRRRLHRAPTTSASSSWPRAATRDQPDRHQRRDAEAGQEHPRRRAARRAGPRRRRPRTAPCRPSSLTGSPSGFPGQLRRTTVGCGSLPLGGRVERLHLGRLTRRRLGGRRVGRRRVGPVVSVPVVSVPVVSVGGGVPPAPAATVRACSRASLEDSTGAAPRRRRRARTPMRYASNASAARLHELLQREVLVGRQRLRRA